MPSDTTNTELLAELDRLREENRVLRERLSPESADVDQQAKSDERYRALVELAADAILAGDPLGNIISANQSAVDLTGYPREELLGLNIGKLFTAEEQALTPLRYDLLRAGKVIQRERQLLRKDGSFVDIGMHSRMMPDGTYQTILRDMTERKAVERQLIESNRELEAFIYTVSHDLRTPLTPIIGFAEYVREAHRDSLDEQSLQFLREIERAGEKMLALIDDLLKLSIGGRQDRPSTPVDAHAVATECLRDLDTPIRVADVVVQLGDLPAAYVSRTSLFQIFSNLISNAVVYGGRPGGVIKVTGERLADRVCYRVTDHGPGIAAQDRERVFDAFCRGADIGPESGTGLGLAIVRRVAKACGGSILLEETPGGGCTFVVELYDAAPDGDGVLVM